MALSKLLSARPETQAELAAKIGVFQTTIGNWRRNDSSPPSTRLPVIAKVLGLDVEALRVLVDRDRKARARRHGSRPRRPRRARRDRA